MANLSVITNILYFTSFFLVTKSTINALAPERATSAWFHVISRSGGEVSAKIHFYVQDVLGGENRTVYEVARASITSTSPTGFGQVRALDDLLTALPDPTSKKVGRIQGLITSADLAKTALAMNLNFYFMSGEIAGSTICMLGRNQLDDPTRELAVVGGTGVFRFARGYAITRLYSYDVETNHGVIEYTLYVRYPDKSSSE
ncbi:Dirigent protein 21 [Striga hermonthica]|uniref:Dirigent protein n=1 Tax=Striga hermonthica TaxID=68872 RepID=A0A9N7MDM9_STRHE|nr:Dirigent protein 21 [Striga hermonthica]